MTIIKFPEIGRRIYHFEVADVVDGEQRMVPICIIDDYKHYHVLFWTGTTFRHVASATTKLGARDAIMRRLTTLFLAQADRRSALALALGVYARTIIEDFMHEWDAERRGRAEVITSDRPFLDACKIHLSAGRLPAATDEQPPEYADFDRQLSFTL